MGVIFRQGMVEDSYGVYLVFRTSITDLSRRQGLELPSDVSDAVPVQEMWKRRQPFFEHLARTAYEFWVAEEDGHMVGYARSVLRDEVLELTEFFVSPEAQSAGVGGELLRRVFPPGVGKHRVIVATTDVRAQVRYLKSGVTPYFPEMYWSREPQNVTVESDLEFVRAANTPETVAQLAEIDRAILGHTRDVDHAFLLSNAEGYLYRRNGNVVGYGYLRGGCGPIALLEPTDFDAVLAHAERRAFERGESEVGFDIPMVNRAAIDYFLAHGYKLDSFIALLMSDAPFGKLENYVLTSPPFIL